MFMLQLPIPSSQKLMELLDRNLATSEITETITAGFDINSNNSEAQF
jgi:hypothetical protein